MRLGPEEAVTAEVVGGGRRRHEEGSGVLEARIAGVLRAGVLLAAALLAAGLPWVMFRQPTRGTPGPSVGEALRDLPSVRPETLAALGVLVLVATPILQLLTLALLFRRKRDRLFLMLTVIVCMIVGLGAILTGGGS